MIKHEFSVPFPPSVNELWRTYHGRTVCSARYRAWIKAAGWTLETTRESSEPVNIPKDFNALIILNKSRFGKMDADNGIKAIFDLAQAHGLIVNDKWCRRLVVEWGDAEGARVTLEECAG